MTTPPRAHSGAKGPPPWPRQDSAASATVMAVPTGPQSATQDGGREKPVPRRGRVTRGVPGDPSLPCPWVGGVCDFSRMEEGGVSNSGWGDRGQVGSGRRERVLDLAGFSSGWTWSPAGDASVPARCITIGLHASCPPSSPLTAVYLSYGSIFTKELQN